MQTIQFIFTSKCIVKKLLCSEYTYEDACVNTIKGIECYWNSTFCIDIC